MATLTDTVGSDNMGKLMGSIGPIAYSGGFLGPMAGGLLLPSVGYWRTWLVPIAMISLDLTLRLAMVDSKPLTGAAGVNAVPSDEIEANPRSYTVSPDEYLSPSSPIKSEPTTPQPNLSCTASSPATSTPSDAMEATPLLPKPSHDDLSPSLTEPLSNTAYFRCILRQPRIIWSSLITLILSIVHNSFGATLALHVEDVFHWGPRQVGFLFLALVSPSVLVGPFAGYLRDSIGVRWPTIVGTGMATPLFVLIGHIGDERLHWMQGDLGKGIAVGALVLMGIAFELTESICIVEGTRMLSIVLILREPILLLILTAPS